MHQSRVFADSGGSAPLSQRVKEALAAGFADGWADPARLSAESRRARALVDGSKEAIAEVIGARPERIYFSPSVHAAFERLIAGVSRSRRGTTRLVTSAIERDALMAAAYHVAPHAVEELGVDRWGHVDQEALRAAVTGEPPSLVAIQHANQELGTVQRLGELSHLVAASGAPLVVDASSSIGHIAAPEAWDMLVAHPADWGGPAGIAVIAAKPHARWLPVWPEGDDFAPGGISVPLALAAAVALQEREENRVQEALRQHELIDVLRDGLAHVPGIDVQGDPVERLPHVVTFSCLYADGEALLGELDREGFAVGSGSACTSGTLEPSRVLGAVGALTHGNVRMALHPGIARHDIDRFLAVLPGVLQRIRDRAGAPSIAPTTRNDA